MDPVIKLLVYIHIKLAKRKISKFELRSLFSIALIIILLGFLVLLANPFKDFLVFLTGIIGVLTALGFIYYWFTAMFIADSYLKRAKESEIINTKYKLEEF